MSASTYAGHIACIGEAMVELMLGNGQNQSADLGFAGDSLNTAIYLKRLLGEESKVSYVTVLGNDPLSQRMVNFIETESINTSFISRSPNHSIGLYAIETDSAGERTFSYWRNQSAARTLFQQADTLDFSILSQFDTVCFSAISLAILPANVRQAFLEELMRLRETKGLTVVFDSNYRPALWESQEAARQCVAAAWRISDIALPSIDDEQALFGDADDASLLARLKSYGISKGALKRGARGPLSLGSSADTLELDHSTPVTIVDTTAAGDSFNAGYLSASLSGANDQAAMLAGHGCSLRVIAHSGAIIPKGSW